MTNLENLELLIDAILQGKELPKDADPEIVSILRSLVDQIGTIEPTKKFKNSLLEKLQEKIRLQKKSSVFKFKSGATFGEKLLSLFRSPQLRISFGVLAVFLITGGIFSYSFFIDSPDSPIIGKPEIKENSVMVLDGTRKKEGIINSSDISVTGFPNEGALSLRKMDDEYNDALYYYEPQRTSEEKYQEIKENSVKSVLENPISTFSVDVDTASYANVRRFLKNGSLPPADAVRVEEMINYFSYDYSTPTDKNPPFSMTTEIGPNPWNPKTKLLLIGLNGYESLEENLSPSNLVFLIDVSGSMSDQNKLPLLKKSLALLVDSLGENDRISVVVYSGASGIVLEGARGNEKEKILTAIEDLKSGGSTNGEAGINLAYSTAEKYFIQGGINRVLLATDGDFNVGISNQEDLKKMIEKKRESGIALSTLGFGMGNYNDATMEELANRGNGNYSYIDSLLEAQKVLVSERGSTLETIAKDTKIQIEFNPQFVSEYRLIGYENRILNREDFNNDTVDAGEIGAGHTVTALYEIALVGEGGEALPPLRYQEAPKTSLPSFSDELVFLKIRYKEPQGTESKLLEFPIKKDSVQTSWDKTSENFRFASAVAAFGQKLRENQNLQSFSYDDIKALANGAKGKDENGYRSEMLQLIDIAKSLSRNKDILPQY
jgi:Ca-activated chloride channel homolog